MKKNPMKFCLAAVLVALTLAGQEANAQGFGKNLLNKAKSAVTSGNSSTSSSSSTSTPSSSSSNTAANTQSSSATSSSASNSGVVYYVSAAGNARANGLSPEAPMKDLQKALNKIKENKEDGAIVKVAEGNYLGYMNAGYIEISNFITLEGGYSADFKQRDPLKYITRIEPTHEQDGTNGHKGLITLAAMDDVMATQPKGTLIIDGLMLNLGLQNAYKPNDPSDPRNGCPSKNFETGRMEDATPPQIQHQIIKGDAAVCGNVIIRNCLIANSTYFGIQFNSRRGEIEIYNCVIISNRYGGVRIDGYDKKGEGTHINFHHNTVAFSWCRDKAMEDMGYGYEFMNRCNADLHHNIFLCNNYSAIARTRIDSEKALEAKKKTNVTNNIFFMNAADIQLPSKGGGKWTNVKVANFEDLDETTFPEIDGNIELKSGDSFIDSIDPDYLQGFASLKVVSSSSFDPNSAANLYRQAHGMNMQGSETIRVSMYGNRYNFDKALKFFGAKEGFGAQKFNK